MSVVDEIISRCETIYDIPAGSVMGWSRVTNVRKARHNAMWLARELLGWSYTDIGTKFKKDHTTVVSAVKDFEEAPITVESTESISEALSIIKEQSDAVTDKAAQTLSQYFITL